MDGSYKKLGDHSLSTPTYDVGLNKEDVSRSVMRGRSGNFLDLGCGDKDLNYLLGIRENLAFDREFYDTNRKWFRGSFEYYGLDPHRTNAHITADICDPDFHTFVPWAKGFFDVAYSNNVFEHLRKPWIAAANILRILKPGGICITIVPFSQRYHAVPDDYFRYTHTGITALFEDAGQIKVLVSGYDIKGRRNDWQGSGKHDDIVPIDELGAWRETWFTVSVIEKL
jgi:SAM-dependent methyltransferase